LFIGVRRNRLAVRSLFCGFADDFVGENEGRKTSNIRMLVAQSSPGSIRTAMTSILLSLDERRGIGPYRYRINGKQHWHGPQVRSTTFPWGKRGCDAARLQVRAGIDTVPAKRAGSRRSEDGLAADKPTLPETWLIVCLRFSSRLRPATERPAVSHASAPLSSRVRK
jgi:hypothetical protein